MSSDDVRAIPSDELDGDEGWERLTDEPDVRGVEAIRVFAEAPWEWAVTVAAMEFVRDDPLESELRDGIDAALRTVEGVLDVDEEDREVWVVNGAPSGEELTQAVARTVDQFA